MNDINDQFEADALRNGPRTEIETLMMFVWNGMQDELAYFLQKHPDAVKWKRQHEDTTALHITARWNDNGPIVDMLLGQGADINARDSAGATPLMTAAFQKDEPCPAIVRLLLDHGADTEQANNAKQTAEMIAQQNGLAEIAAMIREKTLQARQERQQVFYEGLDHDIKGIKVAFKKRGPRL